MIVYSFKMLRAGVTPIHAGTSGRTAVRAARP